MANFEIKNDEVVSVPIKTTNAAGVVEPMTAGDTFTATSDHPDSLGVAISADGAGNPLLVLTPLVQASAGITVTVADADGLASAIQLVDIVQDVTPTNVVLDLADATHANQAVPSNPGP